MLQPIENPSNYTFERNNELLCTWTTNKLVQKAFYGHEQPIQKIHPIIHKVVIDNSLFLGAVKLGSNDILRFNYELDFGSRVQKHEVDVRLHCSKPSNFELYTIVMLQLYHPVANDWQCNLHLIVQRT